MLQAPEKPQVLEIRNTLAARILADPDIAVYLKPFMRGPTTVKAAAEEGKLSIQSMHYRVLQMLRAGLLEVVGLEPRRGRPIKRYQAIARAFRVPLELVPPASLAALEDAVFWKRSFERGVARALGLPKYERQLLVRLNEDGIMLWGSDAGGDAQDFLDEASPAVLNFWSAGLRLSRAEAKALQRELWEVYARYEHRRGPEKYVLHLGLVPKPEG
ncbi:MULTISPECIES: helix-turn-helix domain-containing protein [unclassified Meiothermus]|uniref:helix-turn-helix domain-containing protein n=1 Tax=unclassified Meiothermus TaxID=370471 RepID=UPI000D7C3B32|nr:MULTISPECIES: helix-turn-helix domain-containing protein [unclassified Meiothermus]PZA06259.1 ArsR family transcriptional regulator [Meiothermus sp. Pnk-1]RYM36411.1 ArsR family transcriptional regulator [Meiothermus sp. PNK-Is4]